jgi:4-hydroxy-2-oxoheptanedioate aldolase
LGEASLIPEYLNTQTPEYRSEATMIQNRAKARLKAGEAVVGSWLAVPSAVSARFMAQLGFDYLTVDMEHHPIDIETAAAMFAAIAAAGGTPLARVPWNTAENIKRVLDCGAYGIVVPMVNTRAEAEAAVAAARYPPAGIRSVGGSLHALNFGTDPATYYARANEEVLVVLQAESPAGVENADEILSVPGVDAVFIGPNDLLCQMGHAPRMESDDAQFVDALAHIVKTADRYGVAPGIHTANHEQCTRRMAQGFRFMALASDARLLVAGAQAELSHIQIRGRTEGAGREVLRY